MKQNGRGTGRGGLPLALLVGLMDVCQSVRHFKMLHVSDLRILPSRWKLGGDPVGPGEEAYLLPFSSG